MITQVTHLMRTCLVCGRPLQVCVDYLGHLMACQHCRGQFVANHFDDSDLGENGEEGSSVQRAARLLAMSDHRFGVHRRPPGLHCHERANRPISPRCATDIRASSYRAVRISPLNQLENSDAPDMPTVLLVEYRDDVFARLAADLAARGVQIMRAKNTTQAIHQYVRRPTDVLIVNADHPHESVWLLAAKLHLTHPTAHILGYKRRLSDRDTATAGFLGVDGLIEHQNGLCCLAAEILERLIELPTHASGVPDQGHGTATDQAFG